MSIPSNSYAEKIFAEHPLGLWALDEAVHFISLIDNKNKKFIIGTTSSEWAITGGTEATTIPNISIPITDSPVVPFIINSTTLSLISNTGFFANDLDDDKDTFTIGVYLNNFAGNADNFQIGYKYDSTEVLETFDVETPGYWQFISHTFTIPVTSSEIKIVIKTTNQTSASNDFLINGLSVGQWSESFNSQSTGVTKTVSDNPSNVELIDLPTIINLTTSKASYAYGYGMGIQPGYYLASENKLYAYNDGIPMVFGAVASTKIIPRPNDLPSLIIPGFGFMNKAGQYQDLTFETWIKINSKTIEPRKIIGPINSLDGLYVDGPFLVLRVGEYVGSFQVGEWNRPMLVQIRLSRNSASLLINGEQVIGMITDTDSYDFPKKINEDSKEQDWIGFYAYEDVPLIEIDCPAVYSYSVPELLAKKRFVYGQGVVFPTDAVANLDSFAAFIDYKFANYSNNYIYPDMGVWNRGIKNNVLITRNVLSTPEYGLPDIVLGGVIDTDQWLGVCQSFNLNESGMPFINLNYGGGGYLLFNNFDFLIEDSIKAFYGYFRALEDSTSSQILFKLIDESNGNNFSITVNNSQINYIFTYAGVTTTLYSEPYITSVDFLAGIDIDKFIRYYDNNLSTFFSGRNRLKLYIGGQQDLTQSFNGNIYKVGFLNKRNLNKVSEFFNTNTGIIITDDQNLATSSSNLIFVDGGLDSTTVWQNEIDGGTHATLSWTETLDGTSNADITISIDNQKDHTSTYTLISQEYLETFDLDIATDSYWQDYVPLKTFGKLINDEDGNQVYGLNYLQFNIDYPTLQEYVGNNYDLSNSLAKVYVSFQYVGSGANKSDQNLNTVSLSKTNVIIPGSEWTTSKYEIVNDTIIYLPPSVNFETLALVVHIDISSEGILTKPVKIKNMHMAGQTLNRNRLTPINTKFGVQLFPYYKTGIYQNYQAKNPVNIYKQSTPHLYLTENSGILLRELVGNTDDRGIRLAVNANKLDDYSVGGMLLTMKYEKETFPISPEKIFEIYCKTELGDPFYIKFYIESNSDDNSRGKIYAINSLTDLEYEDIEYFINGKLTKDLNIKSKEWNMIGLEFFPGINFGSDGAVFTGYFNITGQVMFNNIVIQQSPEVETIQNVRTRVWSEINGTYPDWLTISTTGLTWTDLLFAPVIQELTIDTEEIYKNYTQGNKIIASDNTYTAFGNYRYATYNDISWKTASITPA